MGSAGRTDRGTDGGLSLFLLAGGADVSAAGAEVDRGEGPSRVNEAASPADKHAYWASVMVGIGLGREVGAVVYGLFSMLLGGGGTVQVGCGSA